MVKRKVTKATPCTVRKPCPAIGTGRVGELVCYRCRIEHLVELISRAQPLLKNESTRIKHEVARLKIADTPGPSVFEQVIAARAKDKKRRTLEEFNEWSLALCDEFAAAEKKRVADEADIPAGAALSTIPSKDLEELSAAAVALADYHKKTVRWAWREFKKCVGCGEDIKGGKYCATCRRDGVPAVCDMARSRARAAFKAKLKDKEEQAGKLRRK